ncbi:hypothetical protein RvY_17278 [Ramazzottius varieornatus]|uniref:F-box domain-containing protein n=1 Tax=Ramazzottius varieornatus TaxID=947166 RepID=A0A1D1W1J4_RAMVA|nr:hypothetical protein RvY_17278 [Ramazzottius varieornatus]
MMEQWKKRFARRIAPPGWRRKEDCEEFIPSFPAVVIVPDMGSQVDRPVAAPRRVLPPSNLYPLDFPRPYSSPDSSNPQSPTTELPFQNLTNVPVDKLIDLNFDEPFPASDFHSAAVTQNTSLNLFPTGIVIENLLLKLPLPIQGYVLSLLPLQDIVSLSRTSKDHLA